jgi:hypothetical protein
MFASDRMASRAIRIDTNLKGHLCFNPERAKLIKTAIKDGLLKEVKSIEKRDERAIEAILDRFGVPLR